VHSEPLFDLVSYARRGPGRRDHLSPAEIQQIARTVRRTPEVMVKVLPTSANSLAAVRKHLGYIGRRGDLALETDEGERLRGTSVGKDLVEDWDLDLDEFRRKYELTATRGKEPARLVHKVIFSMPAGTPPQKVLTAVKNFAREEFALKHRYAIALHTDEPHPHVHVVIKAVSEQGQRLHIRKATLREWRTEFAGHLRALGVAANATQRYIRGETNARKMDGIYRAGSRGNSTFLRERMEMVAHELMEGGLRPELGKVVMLATRADVRRAWLSVHDILVKDNQPQLAQQIKRFMDAMPPPQTEREQIAASLIEHAKHLRARTVEPGERTRS
jgi:hypothetical protein